MPKKILGVTAKEATKNLSKIINYAYTKMEIADGKNVKILKCFLK